MRTSGSLLLELQVLDFKYVYKIEKEKQTHLLIMYLVKKCLEDSKKRVLLSILLSIRLHTH
ncbi:hypothetical protein HanIR_Chr09g0420091 [Helianthus annuus]|nr:hypothetical protein HanIR_Chr09g0420091 [Helianthus annuus]